MMKGTKPYGTSAERVSPGPSRTRRLRSATSSPSPLPSMGEGITRNENSRVETPEPRGNIERPTSNTERRSERGVALPFDVRCWMFDVGCSSELMGRMAGGQVRGWFMAPRRGWKTVGPFHEPTHPWPLPGGELGKRALTLTPLLRRGWGWVHGPNACEKRKGTSHEPGGARLPTSRLTRTLQSAWLSL